MRVSSTGRVRTRKHGGDQEKGTGGVRGWVCVGGDVCVDGYLVRIVFVGTETNRERGAGIDTKKHRLQERENSSMCIYVHTHMTPICNIQMHL